MPTRFMVLYQYIIAIMIIVLFMLAVGSYLGIGLFANIDKTYKGQLIDIMLIGVAAPFSLFVKDMFSTTRIKAFIITIKYSSTYAEELKAALTDEQRKIVERYESGRKDIFLTRTEQALISELKAANLNAGKTASGDVKLIVSTKSNLVEGTIMYKFPTSTYKTAIIVTGVITEKKMELSFSQSDRLFWDGDYQLIMSGADYQICFEKSAEDKGKWVGPLDYPPLVISVSKLKLAQATLTEVQ